MNMFKKNKKNFEKSVDIFNQGCYYKSRSQENGTNEQETNKKQINSEP